MAVAAHAEGQDHADHEDGCGPSAEHAAATGEGGQGECFICVKARRGKSTLLVKAVKVRFNDDAYLLFCCYHYLH